MTEPIGEILEFWFGELDERGNPSPAQQALWFKKRDSTDHLCRDRFGNNTAAALNGDYDDWVHGNDGLLALIILLDQLTRNIYRDKAAAFSGDTKALAIARAAIVAGRHRQLPYIHRVFLYLPLEHCEDLAAQRQCVELFTELAAEVDSEMYAGFVRYAEAHRDVIALFGRFPHRNKILGRQSSSEELAYLEQHGGF